MEEYELRLVIEELTPDEYNQCVADDLAVVNSAQERIDGFEQELSVLRAALDRWLEAAREAGVVAEPEPEPEAELEVEPTAAPEVDPAVELAVDFDDLAQDQDDVGQAGQEPSVEEEVLVDIDETPEVDLDLGEDTVGGVGFEVGEIDILAEDEAEVARSREKPSEGVDRPRRAVLLYQEGTAEELIYPFKGDSLTIGRSRDNDVQIKSDNKVSRQHCKLTRRGANFYVEDNKSANGTLVNSEPITERRLFGGEELIIGDTYFRFRILD
jgi:predicted component of type VI protein secretion system